MSNETTQTINPLEILIIESNQGHILDANEQWAKIRGKGIPLTTHIIRDRRSLDKNLNERSYDGIITAVSYPKLAGESEMEDGTYAVRIAKEKVIPVVLCADTPWFKTSGVADFCYRAHIPVAETRYASKEGQKPWGYAYQALLWQIALKLQGGEKKIGEKLRLKQETREEIFAKLKAFTGLYGIGDRQAKHADGNEEGHLQAAAFPGEYEPAIIAELK